MPDSSIYSQLKPAWHLDRLEAIREGRRPKPIHVQLILSDLCNQDCSFCAYRMSSGLSNELFPGEDGRRNPNRRIHTAKALEIIDDCVKHGVKAMQFTGGGEPTVHPAHLQVFGYAQDRGLDTALVTNGVKMDPYAAEILAMQWIRVSIDAGDAQMYAQVRRVPEGHWTRVWDNITVLAQRYRGVLGIGYVVTPENWTGIRNAALRARDAGATNIRVGAVFSEEGLSYYSKHHLDLPFRIMDEVEAARAELTTSDFEVMNLFDRRTGDLMSGSPDDPECLYQYLTVYIGGDLGVYRCCNTAYTRAGKVASLEDQRFDPALFAYEPFDARGCRFCQFIGQNKGLIQLTRRPQHENFV